MELEELKTSLNLSLNSNPEIRKENVNLILKAREMKNFGPFLLQISADIKNTFEIQQNAAIQLKNFVIKYWKYTENHQKNLSFRYEEDEKIIVIPSEDKAYIRNNILEAVLFNQNKLIRKQYSECIKKISLYELGKDFKFIINSIEECFNSNNDDKIYGGIIVFCNIAKVFSFESGDIAAPYEEAFNRIHDYFINFLPHLLNNFENEKACYIAYYIVKIYYLSSTKKLDIIIKNKENANKWLYILNTILDKKYKGELIKKTEKPEEIKILNDNIFWKIKIYSMKIFNNFYTKYAYIGRVHDKLLEDFSKLIKDIYSEKFFDVYLNILFSSKEEFIPDIMGGYIFRFFSDAISNNHDLILEKINTNLEVILKDYLIQSVFLRMEDIDLWKNDVKSFLIKQFNFLEGFNSLRNNAIKFTNELCKYKKINSKGKKEKVPFYFENLYKFFVSVLEVYSDHIKNGVQTDFRIKEAVLSIIENISEHIIDNSKNTIEKFFELFLINELMSENPFIRLRSYMVLYSFKNFKLQNIDNLKKISDCIFQSLSDDNLSIKVFACICAPTFFGNKEIKPIINEHISKILSIYISLMNDIEIEEILISLEHIIQQFNEKIKDYVVDLTKILVDRFHKLCKVDDENIISNSLLVKEGLIKTLFSIISIFRKQENLFNHIYEYVREIISYGFTDEGIENFDETIDLIHAILKEGDKIYPKIWEFYIPILESIVGTENDISQAKLNNPESIYIGYGYDNIDSIITNILDIDTFLAGTSENNMLYVKKSIFLVHTFILYGKSEKSYVNVRYAFKIITSIIESSKGKIDGLFVQFLGFLISQFQSKEKLNKEYTSAIVELCSSCLIYNPQITISIFVENNLLEQLLDFWLAKNSYMQYEVNKNKTLIAIMNTLSVNPDEQNPFILKNLKLLVDNLIIIIKDKYSEYEDVMENDQSEKTNFDLEDDEKSKVKDHDDEDNLYDEFEINDSDSDWDQLEFLNDLTSIEKLNPIFYLKEGFEFISKNYSEYYNNILKLMGKHDLNLIQNCIKKEEAIVNKLKQLV